MEVVLKTVKSLAPEFDKSHCFCIPKYLRYEESAKLCLCENEYRKLKNYVGYYKYLRLNAINDEIVCEDLKINKKDFKFLNDWEKDSFIISILQIIKIECTIESLQSRKITINSSDALYNDKVKLLKKENPLIFGLTSLTRKKFNNAKINRQYMDCHLKDIMRDHIFYLNLDFVKREKKGRELVELYRSRL